MRANRRGSVRPVDDDLRHLLDELSAAIERTKEGQEDRAELTRLLDAVEARLQGGAPSDEEHSYLVRTLEKAEVRFEAGHPGLAGAIHQAIQALSSAGI